MMTYLIADALQVGFRVLTLLASPETCGQAMEFLEIMLYSEGFYFFLWVPLLYVPFSIHAARMLTPGAAISGYKERKKGGSV